MILDCEPANEEGNFNFPSRCDSISLKALGDFRDSDQDYPYEAALQGGRLEPKKVTSDPPHCERLKTKGDEIVATVVRFGSERNPHALYGSHPAPDNRARSAAHLLR